MGTRLAGGADDGADVGDFEAREVDAGDAGRGAQERLEGGEAAQVEARVAREVERAQGHRVELSAERQEGDERGVERLRGGRPVRFASGPLVNHPTKCRTLRHTPLSNNTYERALRGNTCSCPWALASPPPPLPLMGYTQASIGAAPAGFVGWSGCGGGGWETCDTEEGA